MEAYNAKRGGLNTMKPPNIDKVKDLIQAAYFEGWNAGALTGESDSPDWDASEDWADSDARKRLRRIIYS